MLYLSLSFFFFFFNDTATTEIYTLSLHDALPISHPAGPDPRRRRGRRGGAHQPERRSRRDPAEDRRDGEEGEGGGGCRTRPALHLAREESARAGDERGARAEPLVRRHRAPAARAVARGEGDRRAGAHRCGREPRAGAGGDAAAARQRDAFGAGPV